LTNTLPFSTHFLKILLTSGQWESSLWIYDKMTDLTTVHDLLSDFKNYVQSCWKSDQISGTFSDKIFFF
jgi:hypothetical protein